MVRPEEIASIIKQRIERFDADATTANVGTIIEVGDGIARVHGLSEARYNGLVEFPNGAMGVVLNLEEETVGVVILGEYEDIREGDEVRVTGRVVEVPVGDELLGRVVDPLGRPLDGRGVVKSSRTRAVERIAPGVTRREPVTKPVLTGIKAIDAMIPLGRGQRELIIGDRATGKSSIAIDAIINQHDKDLLCVYVAIGQKSAQVAQRVNALGEHDALGHTIVVAATASDPAALQYLAPYAGCAMGEEFMEHGRDALVVYDDLSKHAWAYRELSLLLRRPPGREAYPGDVFYLHSRLLERAARMSGEYGGGSLTALPVIETQAGDLSAYIPTNLISITDGQIYLESDLFNAGIRPAINAGLSVSRVGGSAQTSAMKQVAGRLRIDLAQFRELAAFAQFGTGEMDRTTRAQLVRGERIVEVMKQPRFVAVPLAQQIAIFYALNNGHLDDVPREKVQAFETAFYSFLDGRYPSLLAEIDGAGALSDEMRRQLDEAIAECKRAVPY